MLLNSCCESNHLSLMLGAEKTYGLMRLRVTCIPIGSILKAKMLRKKPKIFEYILEKKCKKREIKTC